MSSPSTDAPATAGATPPTGEALTKALRAQIEFYFSRDNLARVRGRP